MAQKGRAAGPGAERGDYDVRDFGALGDGRVKDTAAIQAAIDRCSADGGGRVMVPPGCYLSGTIYLRDDVDFHLCAGARLLGSPDREDYNPDGIFPESVGIPAENASGSHLVIAYRVKNVSLSGRGAIDGNCGAFFQTEDGQERPWRYKFYFQDLHSWPWRPGQMIWFCRCRDVSVRDLRLVNTTFWTLLLHGCEDAHLGGLTIINPPTTRNGDGIGIDCCRNVTVSDCLVRSGDDCITLRGNSARLGDDAPPCENVVVTNCVLSTPTCAIRVGVGDGVIRRCRFSNMVVTDTRTGIAMMPRYSQSTKHGVNISEIDFSDFTMDCTEPFYLTLGRGPAVPALPPACLRDISFSRFRITASRAARLIGTRDLSAGRIVFRDIDWTVRDDPAAAGEFGSWDRESRESALFAMHLEDCLFENIRLRWENPGPENRDGFQVRDSRAVEFRGLVLGRPPAAPPDGAAIHCSGCDRVTVSGCRLAGGEGTFLRFEKSPPGAVLNCRGNDFPEEAAGQALATPVPTLPPRGKEG